MGEGNLLMLEYQWGEVDWRRDLTVPPETVVDGYLALPDAPGLGLRLNEDELMRRAVSERQR
ncbi:MAG: hypothetical protein NZT92_20670 [Abditibacteriales bacterium]|nr:hypothetical protein [Abditibacteriales bacterium]MDW8368128.1 hypothetical protein [Abditibacteriales bacterium]